MRAGGTEQSEDINDIKQLGRLLNIKTSEDALAIVARHYPADRLRPKTQFGLEEIFGKSTKDDRS